MNRTTALVLGFSTALATTSCMEGERPAIDTEAAPVKIAPYGVGSPPCEFTVLTEPIPMAGLGGFRDVDIQRIAEGLGTDTEHIDAGVISNAVCQDGLLGLDLLDFKAVVNVKEVGVACLALMTGDDNMQLYADQLYTEVVVVCPGEPNLV